MKIKVTKDATSKTADGVNLEDIKRVELDTTDGNITVDEWQKSDGQRGVWIELEAPYGTFTIRPQNGCLVLSANWGNISITPRAGNVFELRVA